MIVRCGRCQVELEVAGSGEFLCPACGTKNMVRGPAGPAPGLDPYGLPDLGASNRPTPSPFAPSGDGAANQAPDAPAVGVTWETCPECSYRFARGDVEEISCPACSTKLKIGPDGASPVEQGSA